MPLSRTGAITLAEVNVELGLTSTTSVSLNQTDVRTLATIASGSISMSNLYGRCKLTEGAYVDGTDSRSAKYGYARDAETLFPAVGSVGNANINGTSSQFIAFEYRTVPVGKTGSITLFSFIVTGDQTGSGWPSINYNGITYALTSPFYDSGANTTGWLLSGSNPFTSAGTSRTFTIN
jgi:hypothetical protein